MNKKAVILLSGGLDSTLAACIVKEQGIQVEAVNFQTIFGCCKDDARRVAHELGIGFTLLSVQDDYLKMVEKPRYGYGRGINPCVDCRIYMFEMARKYMEKIGASFLISGEVLYQRPMSQKRKDLYIIERDTDLKGLILRPLSALLLDETEPEKAGIIDRSKLYGFHGRSRKPLLELAVKYGIKNPPDPSAGCALTSPEFAKKVRDVYEHQPDYQRADFEFLKVGRHFRLDDKTKVIVARDHNQNEFLKLRQPKNSLLMSCVGFAGPHALLIGDINSDHIKTAGRIILRYAQKPLPVSCDLQVQQNGSTKVVQETQSADEEEIGRFRIV